VWISTVHGVGGWGGVSGCQEGVGFQTRGWEHKDRRKTGTEHTVLESFFEVKIAFSLIHFAIEEVDI
jgi:hypothetical protein